MNKELTASVGQIPSAWASLLFQVFDGFGEQTNDEFVVNGFLHFFQTLYAESFLVGLEQFTMILA